AAAAPKAPNGDDLAKVCTIVRRRTGHDFSQYKQGTLIRRIQRRMQVLHLDTMHDYVERLRHEPKEPELLYADLLIGVTEFFRTPEAFDVLANNVIPHLLEGRTGRDEVRIWVPGCASGEEPYSIAMLIREQLSQAEVAPDFRIFATDIDEQALETARRA